MSDKAKSTGFASAAELDARLKRQDEPRWLATRYAVAASQRCLVALYLLDLEMRRAFSVGEPILRQIRFRWWLDAIAGLQGGEGRVQHEVLSAVLCGFGERGLEIKDAVPLVEAWSRKGEGALDADPEVACVQLAMRCLDPEAGPAEMERARSLVIAARSNREPGGYPFKSNVLPAVLHFAAYDAEQVPLTGLRARWRVFCSALTGRVLLP